MTESPVTVRAHLDEPLSRWLWLVKWLLAIPHFIILIFLWIGFVVVTVIAFFAILFTARYPRGLFDFNVGVMRWTWRVGYYTYDALGTDRYPPFSLADDPDYPARLDVRYPQSLSRGLVLVKWWLLAIPHYVIVAFFVGGAWTTTTWDADDRWAMGVHVRRPDRGLRTVRRHRFAVHRALPARALRVRHGHEPVGAAGDRLRRTHDRHLPTVPPRPRRHRARRRRAGATMTDGRSRPCHRRRSRPSRR